MTYECYDAIDAVRWSDLKTMDDGPRAYLHHKDTGGEDSDALAFGRLFHSAVFEPDTLPLAYAVWKRSDGNRVGAKYKEFVEANAPAEVVREVDYLRALEVRDAVNSHPVAQKLLARKGERETVVQWTDAETGLACKCRFDYLITDGRPTNVDAKSTGSARLDSWAYSAHIAKWKYHGQAGYYRDGAKAALGLDVATKHIAVQSQPPYEVHVFTLSPDMVWQGSDLAHRLLAELAACQESGEWPWKYPNDDVIDLPAYMRDDADVGDIMQLEEKQ